MKQFNKKVLSATVSMMMTWAVCGSIQTSVASDIEIYKDAAAGKVTLFMMFDTSGSMGHGDGYWARNLLGIAHGSDTVDVRNSTSSLVEDYNICKWSYDWNIRNGYTYSDNTKTDKKIDYKVGNGTTKSFYPTYCSVNQSTFNNLNSTYKSRIEKECEKTGGGFPYVCYDRISRLKMAMIKLLTGDQILNTTRIGIGQFSSPVNSDQFSHDGKSAKILYPAVELTAANREKLLEKIVSLDVYNGTPSAMAYAESAAYLLGANTSGMTNSGYAYSDANTTPKIRNANNGYVSPLTGIDTSSQCNGQGIYFLTDGFANNSYTATQTMMEEVLGENLSGTGLTGSSPSGNDPTQGWPEIGKFAKLLRNEKYIKTAVVGFGSLFPNDPTYVKTLTNTRNKPSTYYDCSKLPNPNASGISDQEKSNRQDLINTCNWGAKPQSDIIAADRSQIPSSVGGYGNGGFYSAQSINDVVNSVVKFLDDVDPNIEPVTTGSPTIPIDSLNPIQLQPYGYYAEFKPKPSEKTQLWAGNLNKYNVIKGELVDKNLQRLILSTGALNKDAVGLWTNGVKGQLPLGTLVAANGEQNSKRKVFTNRVIKQDKTAVSGDRLAQVSLLSLFAENNEIAKFKYDDHKNYWLNFLGYDVGITESIASLADLTSKEEYRELGSVMHSTPVMLTQEGKITVVDGKLTTTGRKDYLMFGSTQGALHVVDDEGKEVFAFVPHEMMEKQKNAFIGSGKYEGSGKNDLFYGVDGPWVAHTQYVSKSDGTLTVKDSGRKASDEENAQNLIGMQWVYGGLRMGGKSYYALDLTDIEKPELKFHINPDADNASAALKQMGQSWSKPTLAYVNWGDTRKLVMFVGGGYDPIYETHNANPSSTKGNGVYMFDAHNGDLLWWASDSEKTGASRFTQNNELKYSVVSQINAIDRDGDGLTDHIYFGDLGGQAFRVDFNNRATDTANFATRAVRLFTEHQGSGLSPRFYEMPSVSIHQDDGSYFAAVAFSSGNRSSPLAGLNSTDSANDAVFVVYDNDVARQDLYKTGITLNTEDESLTQLNFDSGVARRGQNNIFNGGWKAYFDSAKAGRYKGMNDLYALDGMLYVNVYDRDGTGIGGNCGAGVAGDSYLYQYCLPTGKCSFYSGTGNKPGRVKLGAGILGTGLGQGYGNKENTVSLVVNRDEPSALDCTLPANKNLPQCQLFNTQVKLKQMRWYESR
ncbi:pilus assembly protein tip-associated adhesin PilY1 [Acinetobacter sp. HA]|uniref:pilus assembly protein n=1 Tax=Acinetobacter sp. HA TaxID=1173062 RepID=UPI000263E2F9|nr:PilC/PilY family type IV pilus protein [Acinetobacter sp. HA]EIM40465.1 pilus assembly protein tip-associated adhesin PilY1 [Acinetobacter sp. HA]